MQRRSLRDRGPKVLPAVCGAPEHSAGANNVHTLTAGGFNLKIALAPVEVPAQVIGDVLETAGGEEGTAAA